MKCIVTAILLFILLGCSKTTQKLYLPNSLHIGNIKTDGYYLNELRQGSYEVFFVYRNGAFLGAGTVDISKNEKTLDESIKTYKNLGYYKNHHYAWGIWHIEGDKIIIEKWTVGSGKSYYPIGRYIGNVVNDSTINIAFTYANPPKGNEKKELFRFKEFSPKPDSTNTFIE